jgi:hypothetical protein
VGASSAGGGASGRGEERTDSAKAKIKAATHRAGGLSLITAAVIHWDTVYLDRAVRRSRPQGTTVPGDLLAHVASPVQTRSDPSKRATEAKVKCTVTVTCLGHCRALSGEQLTHLLLSRFEQC